MIKRISKLVFIPFIGVLLLAGCHAVPEHTVHKENPEAAVTIKEAEIATSVTNAAEAKARLQEGNQRYLQGISTENSEESRRLELAEKGQAPFAIILGCSDSRVPPEVIFDQGLGDLFVVRNAGNVVDPVVLGTIEYGAEHLGAPLIVILGHEKCGAVKATVDGAQKGEAVSGELEKIMELIVPSYDKVMKEPATARKKEQADLYEVCADENIRAAMEKIKENQVVKHLLELGKVSVIGAKYQIDTGAVTFIEE